MRMFHFSTGRILDQTYTVMALDIEDAKQCIRKYVMEKANKGNKLWVYEYKYIEGYFEEATVKVFDNQQVLLGEVLR